jgi:uncharacterized RDD family membrane protein YckC
MSQWYYVDEQNLQQGPLGAEQVTAAFRAGRLSRETLVWRDGMSQWTPLGQFALEFDLDDDEPPAPVAASAAPVATPTQVWTPAPAAPSPAAASPYAAPSAPLVGAVAAGPIDTGYVVYAGFWKRVAAFFIDSLLVGAVNYALMFVLMLVFGLSTSIFDPSRSSGDPAMLAFQIANWVVSILVGLAYYGYLHASPAQATFGKQLIGIKVTDLSGGRISFARSIGRYFSHLLMAMVSICLLYAPFWMAGITERKQALHDMMASTLVVDRYAFTDQPQLQREELGGCAIAVLIAAALLVAGTVAMVFVVISMIASNLPH